MRKEEAWFVSLIVAANVVVLMFYVCRGCIREHREDYVRDRIVDNLRNKIYCKECRSRENIRRASVSFRERGKYGDWYHVCIETVRHEGEPFGYNVTINPRNGCIGTLEQDEGPGANL